MDFGKAGKHSGCYLAQVAGLTPDWGDYFVSISWVYFPADFMKGGQALFLKAASQRQS